MPTVRFSAPARNFLRLGSVHLKPETEPDQVRIGNCCAALNPLGTIACTEVGFPGVMWTDWGSTGVEVTPSESKEIVTAVAGGTFSPAGTEYGTYAIIAPPTLQGTVPIESGNNCNWSVKTETLGSAQTGSNEQLLSGDIGDPFTQVWSAPHLDPLSVTGAASSQAMEFALSLKTDGSGLYWLEGTLGHGGTASYDGYFTVNDSRFAADGDYFLVTINAAPDVDRPWYDWWRNNDSSSWLYANPDANNNNGANGRREQVLNKAGSYTYKNVAPVARPLIDWAVAVSEHSIELELTGSPAPGREGFITGVPSNITLSW
jgi:hypothetical protein